MTKRNSFLLGFVAGILTLTISLPLRLFAGGVFIPELASQTLFSLVPGKLMSIAVGTLGALAKNSAFIGAIIINLILYGVLGLVLSKKQIGKGYLVEALQFSLVGYASILLVAIILYQISRVLTQPISSELLVLSLLPPHLVFGFTLAFFTERTTLRETIVSKTAQISKRISLNRRNVIRLGILSAIALFSSYGLSRLFHRRSSQPEIPSTTSPPSSKSPHTVLESFIESEVTPNELFYTIDINLLPIGIDIDQWRLDVKGRVSNPLELTYETLQSMPAVERYATLECISNPLDGSAISTALWKGVLLNTILEQAQVQPEAVFIVFRCLDGYSVGIPLDRGRHNEVILAYEMNGVRLSEIHGYPIRVITPGIYGMMNPKWISRIDLVSSVYYGYWQRRGWSNTAEYQTHSMIVNPGRTAVRKRFGALGAGSSEVVVGETVLIAGIAFTGGRGISKVEVSVDGNNTWKPAKVKNPLSEDTWALWSLEWNPTTKGDYQITVRAFDGAGIPQIAESQAAFPDGTTGYHIVTVTAIES